MLTPSTTCLSLGEGVTIGRCPYLLVCIKLTNLRDILVRKYSPLEEFVQENIPFRAKRRHFVHEFNEF